MKKNSQSLDFNVLEITIDTSSFLVFQLKYALMLLFYFPECMFSYELAQKQ